MKWLHGTGLNEIFKFMGDPHIPVPKTKKKSAFMLQWASSWIVVIYMDSLSLTIIKMFLLWKIHLMFLRWLLILGCFKIYKEWWYCSDPSDASILLCCWQVAAYSDSTEPFPALWRSLVQMCPAEMIKIFRLSLGSQLPTLVLDITWRLYNKSKFIFHIMDCQISEDSLNDKINIDSMYWRGGLGED